MMLTAAFAMLSAMVVGAVVAIVLIRNSAEEAEHSATEARAAEGRATEQERAARNNEKQARAAEQRLAEQLDAFQHEQREHQAAEERATTTSAKLTMTYDEWQAALAVAKRETQRAVEALKAEAEAAARERVLRTQKEKLLAEKQLELDAARAEGRKINTTLKRGKTAQDSVSPQESQ
jgi:hypothetical protein